MEDVKGSRDRRARKAAETRERIVDAAGRLFTSRGYAATTIDAVATEADVAVETVYARFRNKRNLLQAFLDVSIVGDADPVPLLERPDVRALRELTDQREQIQRLARVMRGVLERSANAHAVLHSAGAVEADVRTLVEEDDSRRRATHRAFVEIIASRGPLRPGLSVAEAADTLSAIAGPDTFALLTTRRGWSAARFERWVATTLALVLLPPA